MSMLSYGECLREDGPTKSKPNEEDAEVLKAYKDWKDKDSSMSFIFASYHYCGY